MPSASRLDAACRALGLRVHLGDDALSDLYPGAPDTDPGGIPPARHEVDNLHPAARDTDRNGIPAAHLSGLETHTQGLVRVVSEAGGDPIPLDLREALLVQSTPETEDVPYGETADGDTPSADVLEFTGAAVAGVPDDADDVPGARPVGVWEVDSAAGAGALVGEERRVGRIWFRGDWLAGHGLNARQCDVIGVRGRSMEPLLYEGDSILVARDRRRRRAGRIYVVRDPDHGLVVKRLDKDEDGGWLLVSEAGPPEWPTVPWPDDAEIVGEVAWSARAYLMRR